MLHSKFTYGGKNILDAKDLCLDWLPVDTLQSSYMGKKKLKTKGSLSRRIASGLWGFTFDSPNLLN
jgi:hypothetical protein